MATDEKDVTFSPSTLERASFIVGLSAALIAFAPYRASLDSIILGNFFGYSLTIYTTGVIFLFLLILSAYLYGLNNIRYAIPRLLEVTALRYLETFALFVYIAAFAVPVFGSFSWIIWQIAGYLARSVPKLAAFVSHYPTLAPYFGGLMGVLSGLFVAYLSRSIMNYQNEILIEEYKSLSRSSEISEVEANAKKDPRLQVLSLYQSIISELKLALAEVLGSDVEKLTNPRIIRTAKEIGLISASDRAAIEDLRGLRNQVAHDAEIVITEQSIAALRAQIKLLLEKLKKRHG